MSDGANEELQELQSRIKVLLDTFDPDALVRTDELGWRMDFSSHVGPFRRVLDTNSVPTPVGLNVGEVEP